MAATKYTYSISADFPNQQVDSDSLTTEIEASSISSAALLYIETNGDVCDVWFDDPLSTGDQTTLDGLVAAHTGNPEVSPEQGGITLVPLDTPGAPTVTPQGTPGSTTWGYKVTAFSESGETLASTEGQTTTGAATLNATNFNRLSWDEVAGAAKYGIYRATAGGTPSSTGKIVEVSGTNSLQFDDTGQAATGSEPTADMSGAINVADGTVAVGASSMTGNERLKVVGSVLVDQDEDAVGLDIDSEATGSPLVNLQPLNTNTRGDVAFGNSRSADPSTPSEGDAWYNSTDEAIKFRNGSEVIGLNGFLPEFAQGSSDAQSSTTSTDWQRKLRVSVTGVPAGTYRIGVCFTWGYSDRSADFQGRVQVDDTTTVWKMRQEPKDSGSDQQHPAAGFAYATLTAGDHDIDLDYRTSSGGDTARIANARLEFWRVA